jgi:hypothetical protein
MHDMADRLELAAKDGAATPERLSAHNLKCGASEKHLDSLWGKNREE